MTDETKNKVERLERLYPSLARGVIMELKSKKYALDLTLKTYSNIVGYGKKFMPFDLFKELD